MLGWQSELIAQKIDIIKPQEGQPHIFFILFLPSHIPFFFKRSKIARQTFVHIKSNNCQTIQGDTIFDTLLFLKWNDETSLFIWKK